MKTENILTSVAILCLLIGGLIGFQLAGTNEVIKEVPVYKTEYINNTVIVTETEYIDYLADAKEEFWKAVEDDDEIQILGKFDFDSLSEKRTSDEFTVKYSDDEYFVQFSLDVKYKESDLNTKVKTYDVKVIYEEDEVVVELL